MHVAVSFHLFHTVVMLIWYTVSVFSLPLPSFPEAPVALTSLDHFAARFWPPYSFWFCVLCEFDCIRNHTTQDGTNREIQSRDAWSLFVTLTSLSPKGLGNTKLIQIVVSWKNNNHYCRCFIFVKAAVPQILWRWSAECQAICWSNKTDRCMSGVADLISMNLLCGLALLVCHLGMLLKFNNCSWNAIKYSKYIQIKQNWFTIYRLSFCVIFACFHIRYMC